jgi:adenine deaminase
VISVSRWHAFEALLGRRGADLVIRNGRVVDVHGRRIVEGGVAIVGDRIARIGDVESLVAADTVEIDAGGRYVTPGLIDTHAHSYHCHLSMTEYARLCLRCGTTTVTESSYGQGQVGGLPAVRHSLDELRRTPIGVFFQLPILAYLQNVELGLAPTPNRPSEDEMAQMLDWEGCVGLEEPPSIPLVERDPGIERLISEALARGQVVMGHGAGLTEDELVAYASMGVSSDHECVTAEEATWRVGAGMMVAIRECSIARDQERVQRAIVEDGMSPDYFMYSIDVPDAVAFDRDGHVSNHVRLAIRGGVDPIEAIRMGTINAARYYRADEEVGSLAPGRLADVLIVGDLESFDVHSVIAKGRVVVAEGEERMRFRQPVHPHGFLHSMAPLRPVGADELRIEAPLGATKATVRVIDGAELYSPEVHVELPCRDGAVQADPQQDVLKIAMVDRNGVDRPPGIGFIRGFGLKRGAIGSSYNPYFNNPLGVGVDDAEVAHAINEIAAMGGGFAVVCEGKLLGSVGLPLFGLLSELPADDYIARMKELDAIVHGLGCEIESPFQQLAFNIVGGELAKLKLAIGGMFDVDERAYKPALV